MIAFGMFTGQWYFLLFSIISIFFLFVQSSAVRKTALTVIFIDASLTLAFLCLFLFPYYLGFAFFFVPLIFIGTMYFISLLSIWKISTKKVRKRARLALLSLMLISSAAVIGFQIWRESLLTVNEFQQHDLGQYRPFSADAKLASPDSPSTFKLADNLPRIDGATALYPLYAAFVQATSIIPSTINRANRKIKKAHMSDLQQLLMPLPHASGMKRTSSS